MPTRAGCWRGSPRTSSDRKSTGRTPHHDLVRFRIDRVEQLLGSGVLEPEETPEERIATLAGFDHPEYMSVAFKRETGTTQGKVRQLAHRSDPLDTAANG